MLCNKLKCGMKYTVYPVYTVNAEKYGIKFSKIKGAFTYPMFIMSESNPSWWVYLRSAILYAGENTAIIRVRNKTTGPRVSELQI